VERKEQGEITVLTYRAESQRVNTPYFHKLVSDAGYFGFKERKERKEEYLYSAIYTRSTHTLKVLRHGSPANYTMPAFPL